MTGHRDIRRLPSGAIDTEYYMSEARAARSRAVMAMLAAAGAKLRELAALVARQQRSAAG